MTSSIPAIAEGLSEERRAELTELADGLEHAAKVAWRWLKEDESPWERSLTLRMVGRLSEYAAHIRSHLQETHDA